MSMTSEHGDGVFLADPLEGFTLQVRVIAETVSDDGLVPCGTGDGCGQTCASACVNSGV